MKKKIYLYHNLPPGGAYSTYQSFISTMDNKDAFELHEIRGLKAHPHNLISYMYSAIVLNYIHDYKLAKVIKTDDILVCFQSWLIKTPYILLLSKARHKVYICHEPPREYYDKQLISLKSLSHRIVDLVRIPIKWIDKYIATNSRTKIIANSKFSRKLIKDAYNLSSEVIYPPVNNAYRDYSKITSNRFIQKKLISVGTIQDHKGFEFIVRVIGKITSLNRPSLVLIGNSKDKKYSNKLLKLAKELNVNLKILLHVSNDILVQEYRSSLGLIYAPINEPFGLTVVESMLVGLPLFIYRYGGGYSEVISNKNGIIFNSLIEEEWAGEIANRIKDTDWLQRVSKYNMGYSKKFLQTDYGKRVIDKLR